METLTKDQTEKVKDDHDLLDTCNDKFYKENENKHTRYQVWFDIISDG